MFDLRCVWYTTYWTIKDGGEQTDLSKEWNCSSRKKTTQPPNQARRTQKVLDFVRSIKKVAWKITPPQIPPHRSRQY